MLHFLLSKREIYLNSMFIVPTDYVEIPSKFFENWAYNDYGLGCLVKSEYKNLITKKLISKLINYRDSLYSIEYSEYLIKAFVDFELHSNKNTNSKQILRYLNKKFYKITNTPEEINVLSRWPHLVSGYESKFYSYMWSDEYAKKIYDKFKKTNNIKLFANKYMEMLLEPGSLMNYEQELNNFLELKI